jgi:hypothetical protein
VTVKTIWTSRIARATTRYGEVAPTATVCCNACRTCVQTNLLAAATAAVAGLGIGAARLVRRARSRPQAL